MGSRKSPGSWRSAWRSNRRDEIGQALSRNGGTAPWKWLSDELDQYSNITPAVVSKALRRWNQAFVAEGMADTGYRLIQDTVVELVKANSGNSTLTAVPRRRVKQYARLLHGEETFQIVTLAVTDQLVAAVVDTPVDTTSFAPTAIVSGDAEPRHDVDVMPVYACYDGEGTLTNEPKIVFLNLGASAVARSSNAPGDVLVPEGVTMKTTSSEIYPYPDADTKTRVQALAAGLLGEEEL